SLDVYNGKVLAAKGNVIVVNINYRVGSFGFLFLDDDEVPGNVGLLDQRLALHWVQENIAAFGGDPNNVCLFGESAGAAAIFAHVVSEKSRDLFHRVIVQSSSMDTPWAVVDPVTAKARSEEFAAQLDCKQSNVAEMAACLRDKTPEDLNSAYWNVAVRFMEFPLVIVSKDHGGFFTTDAIDAWKRKDFKPNLQILIGTDADEGSYWAIYYLPDYYK
ncbi:unnamed protein product, partial [Soboliphyme baturini]|uniref:Carboxylic ester hydrolase n=1 Tax=Soboliphyme baturini TaxID=241478 RepID=A0A183IAK3_9BILA